MEREMGEQLNLLVVMEIAAAIRVQCVFLYKLQVLGVVAVILRLEVAELQCQDRQDYRKNAFFHLIFDFISLSPTGN
jgi:hypothetical protein